MTDKHLIPLLLVAYILPANGQEVKSQFNPDKVILPSSQYTPANPYTASVWVFNDGKRYADQYYNHIWATPPADRQGNPWYAPEYAQEDTRWQNARAPYSSDEYYLGQKSFRWVEAEIMGEIYIRRTFTINRNIEADIFLSCGHDDAPSEWYINGTMVHSVGDGWNNDEYVLLTPEQKALIKMDGSENIIAAHIHQNWGGAFADCGLYEADMVENSSLLSTLDDGAWPCRYYMLNYNSDMADAENANWASEEEDEDDWISGVGPFSNDANIFLTTEWPSQERPILVRRHFSLSDAEISPLAESSVKLLCSYDENPKVYLNGSLIWQSDGWNDNKYATITLSDEHKKLLHKGDNVLAVSLTQGGGGGHIDYGLIMEHEISFSGIVSPTDEPAASNPRIYNINGQYLGDDLNRLPKGIYIQGNKKIIKL